MTTHITSEARWFHWDLKGLWRYRELIRLFAKKSLTVTYKQTVLGPLWLIVNPLLSSFVYMILFGRIADLGTEGIPQFLFYLSGTALWTFFSTCLTANSTVFLSNAHLFGKVYFPRLTVPIANCITALVKLGVQLIPVAGLLVYYIIQGAVEPHPVWLLLLPFCLVQTGLLGMGCGLILSSITARYRDISSLVPIGTQLWMYATPVVYPLSRLPSGVIRRTVLLNPVTMCMEVYRRALFGIGQVQWRYLFCSWAVTAGILLLGLLLFSHVERTFLDTV